MDSLTLPLQGLSKQQRRQVLAEQLAAMGQLRANFAGFQTNQRVDTSEIPAAMWRMDLLNLGDCWQAGYYRLNSKAFEQAVLDWYARLWHLPAPYWGYLTAMGATEGNLYCLQAARSYLQQQHGQPPVLFYAASSHYSLHKAAHLLQLATPDSCNPRLSECATPLLRALPLTADGALDIEQLLSQLQLLWQLRQPVILVLTLGCTLIGRADPWRALADRLLHIYGEAYQQHCWLHLDGALGANYLPFTSQPIRHPLAPDFRHPLLHSVCSSPYKWLGLPFPVGLVLTRRQYQLRLPQFAGYTGSEDNTIAGSRPGLAAVLLWEQLGRRSVSQQQQLWLRLQQRLQRFEQAVSRIIRQHDPTGLRLRLYPRPPESLMLVFSAPNQTICHTFSLPVSRLPGAGWPGLFCHVVVLEHCHQSLLDRLIQALQQPDAFVQPATAPAINNIPLRQPTTNTDTDNHRN